MACVYQIKNKIDGKIYVGSTKNFEVRKRQHINELDNETHGNTYLQNAWNKYGENNFEFSILEEVELKDQFIKEQEWINKLNPFDEKGYNIERLTYKGAESPHVINKECIFCGNSFETYKDIAKYCDKCRDMLKRVYFTSLDSNECLICKTCEKNDDCFKNTAIFDNEINEWICNIEDACYKVDHCSTCDIDLECKLCKENTAKFKNKVYNYDRYY